jgi:hypothetical protein
LSQFTYPQPDDNSPVVPLKVFALPVGETVVVEPAVLGTE